MASRQDAQNIKKQIFQQWDNHFVMYPACDAQTLDDWLEDLKSAHPREVGGELLQRVRRAGVFSAAAENPALPLFKLLADANKRTWWRVVHHPRVAVRASPSCSAMTVGFKEHGAVLEAVDRLGHWIQLKGASGSWCLVDGAELGIGVLLLEISQDEAVLLTNQPSTTNEAPARKPPPQQPPKPSSSKFPALYVVAGKGGALLRKDFDLDSPRIKPNLQSGHQVSVSEERAMPDGSTRLHVVDPVDGWVSSKVMTAV